MSATDPIRILCIDDHPLMRAGIAAVIRNESDLLLVGEASNGHEAIELYRSHLPDITLMDLRLPDISGIDAMIAIRTEFPTARVIILTTFEGDAEIHRALDAGARGYMLKSMPRKQLVEMIRRVHSGKKHIPSFALTFWAELLAICLGFGLLLGFLTPIAAGVSSGYYLLLVLQILLREQAAPQGEVSAGISLAVTAAALVLLGPGAYSLDARIFGRREIIIPEVRHPSQ